MIGIVGTGRLGICMALCLDQKGIDVLCYDINMKILNDIKNKKLSTNEPFVSNMLANSTLKIANNEEEMIELCDIIFVFIQTPSLESGEYNHSYIDNFINNCIQRHNENHEYKCKIISISSTIMPEYTDTLIDKFKQSNINIDICYNPTFIAQGSIIQNLINPELILIGGYSMDSMNVIENIHKQITNNNVSFHKMTPIEAEITKISINCFITTKISFANMIGDLLISKNINPDTALNAIGSDSRIGNKYLKYGYGFGGPCFPRDNRALNIYSKKTGFDFVLCQTTDYLNEQHLKNQFEQLKNNSSVEFEYITYKDTSDILEESQKLKLALMLYDAGCKVIIRERAHIIEKLKTLYFDKNFVYETI